MNTNNTTNLFEGTLNLAGTIVAARCVDQNVYSFGDTKQMNRAHLESVGETIGFLNAVADFMDSRYAIVEAGFHSKVLWALLPTKVEGDNIMYVNFDILAADSPNRAELTKRGITQQEGQHGWLALKSHYGRLFPSYRVDPKTREQLIGGRKVEEVPGYEFESNNKAWNELYKHNGLYLVDLLVSGLVRVVIAPKIQFDWQPGVIREKFSALFGSAETRQEKRENAIARAQGYRSLKNATWVVQHNIEAKAAVDEVIAGGLKVLIDGQATDVVAEDLVGKRVRFCRQDGSPTKRIAFISNRDRVDGIVLQALNAGMILAVEAAA